MATIYKGFSTVGRKNKFRLTDYELAKQDLINHFYIRKGEKLMHPNYGTIIWNVLFEQFTEQVKSAIKADVMAIVTSDPRLAVDNVVIKEYLQGIELSLDLRYIVTNQTETLNLLFDNSTKNLTVS